jgi:predicted RNA binding protein YcfA (HicA-like mRNA interferase family)
MAMLENDDWIVSASGGAHCIVRHAHERQVRRPQLKEAKKG